jgi:hypothetical protein
LRVFDGKPEVKAEGVAIARAELVIGPLAFDNVKRGAAIYFYAETENKAFSLYPTLK